MGVSVESEDLARGSFSWGSTSQRPYGSQYHVISQRDVLVPVSLGADAAARIQVQII